MIRRKIVSLMIVLALMISMAPIGLADSDISGSKKALPAELTPDGRQTVVTLSLPSAEYQNEIDVVFVIDKSTSTVNNNIDFGNAVINLLENISEKNVTANVGVIKFRGAAVDTIEQVSDGAYHGLTPLNDTTQPIILSAVTATVDGNGSNLHGGLVLADQWLTAGKEEGKDQYLIVLSDGKTYIWNDADGNPTTIYSQYYKHGEIQGEGKPSLNQNFHTDKYAYVPVISGTAVNFSSYQELFESTNAELTGPTKYDTVISSDWPWGSLPGSVSLIDLTNGPAVVGSTGLTGYLTYHDFTPEAVASGVNWMEANPYEIVQNGSSYEYDLNQSNPDYYMYHVSNLEKGLYKSGHLYAEMTDRYHCAIVYYKDWGGATGLDIAKDFVSWMANESAYAADIGNASAVNALFDSIQQDIIYQIGKGTVTDVIDSHFDLVVPSDGTSPFTLTVDGTALPASQDGVNPDQWNIGDKTVDTDGDGAADDYPYRIVYLPAAEGGEQFVWTINVPVENAARVQLSYTLEIGEETADGKYDTNEQAVLSYMSTIGETGEYAFEIPQVTYSKPGYTITASSSA